MTSDAKIGLLLGFVFILVIVSLVNGLPSLIGKDSSNNDVNTTVPQLKTEYGLPGKAREVVNFVDGMGRLTFEQRSSDSNDDPRFAKGRDDSKNGDNEEPRKKSPAGENKFYVVQDGDNLGKIAIKVYGKEFGNKQAAVDMIFKANSHILDSPNDINIDQKLIIPSLGGQTDQTVLKRKAEVEENKSSGLVGAVKHIFGRKKKTSNLYAEYEVKHDDNLWKIATTQLGDGSRSVEIKKINKSILKGSDKLSPGMKIKIPKK